MIEMRGSALSKGVASYPAMLARLALLAVAAVMVVLLASSLRGYDACEAARQQVIGAAAGRLPADRQAPATAAVREHCRGAAGIISVAAVLHRQGRDGEAQQLAQEATRAEPGNATAWNALAISADGAGDSATAQRAARRAVALSPLDPPPVAADGASGP
jgi:Flp pilus assembly protein TadD